MRVARLGVIVLGVFAGACHSSTSPTTSSSTTATTTPTYTLSVSGSPVLTGLRQRSQMSAVITNDDGTTQDVTKTSTWLSADTSAATVSSSGVVTTIAPGFTHLTAVYQTTTQGFDVQIIPVTTTFAGNVMTSDGRNGTFTLVINGAPDLTPNTVSAQVSGTIRLEGNATDVVGFFESLTGAITFSGTGIPYRFDGTVANGGLTASFTGPGGVSGVMASTSVKIS